jgi:hypothetical protein
MPSFYRAKSSPYYSNAVGNVTFSGLTAESSNARDITGQLKTTKGRNVSELTAVKYYLSTTSNGLTPADPAITNAPVTTITAGKIVEGTSGTKGMLTIVPTAAGLFTITITTTLTGTWYPCIILPDGRVVVGPAILFA